VPYIEQIAFAFACQLFSCFVPSPNLSFIAPAGKRVLIQLGQPDENNILTLIHDLFTWKKPFKIRLSTMFSLGEFPILRVRKIRHRNTGMILGLAHTLTVVL
jgi:hypothetical protein